MTQTTQSSIAKKMVQVMRDCGYIQKDATHSYHKFNYVSAGAILEKVNESLVRNGLATFCKPEIISTEIVSTNKGGQEKLVTIRLALTIIDSDSGESIEIFGLGSGQDAGDKGVLKAQTLALKYAWMTTLNIATGDDPEADDGLAERTSVAEVWAGKLRAVSTMAELESIRSDVMVFYKELSKGEKEKINEAAMAAKSRIQAKQTQGGNHEV